MIILNLSIYRLVKSLKVALYQNLSLQPINLTSRNYLAPIFGDLNQIEKVLRLSHLLVIKIAIECDFRKNLNLVACKPNEVKLITRTNFQESTNYSIHQLCPCECNSQMVSRLCISIQILGLQSPVLDLNHSNFNSFVKRFIQISFYNTSFESNW